MSIHYLKNKLAIKFNNLNQQIVANFLILMNIKSYDMNASFFMSSSTTFLLFLNYSLDIKVSFKPIVILQTNKDHALKAFLVTQSIHTKVNSHEYK